MTERCRVKKVGRSWTVIVIERRPECEGCKICSFNNKSSMTAVVKTVDGLKVGDTVSVEMPTQSTAFASLILYVIPLFAMLIGMVAGINSSVYLQMGLAFSFLVLSFGIVALCDRHYRSKRGFLPTILEIVDDCATECAAAIETATDKIKEETKEIDGKDDESANSIVENAVKDE